MIGSLVAKVHHGIGTFSSGGSHHQGRSFEFNTFWIQSPRETIVNLLNPQIAVSIHFYDFARFIESLYFKNLEYILREYNEGAGTYVTHCFDPFAVAALQLLHFGRIVDDCD